LFTEVAGSMREGEDVIKMFLTKLLQGLRPEDTDENDVTFIQAMGKHSSREAREVATDLLWRIVFSEKCGYSKQLVKPTKKLITDLLRNADRELKDSCIAKCIDIITCGGGASYQATSMLVKLLETLPKYSYSSSIHVGYVLQISLKEFVKDLVETQNLVDILL
jgi:hypothetical protein